MVLFDMKTAIAVYSLINIVLTFMVYIAWTQNKNRFNGLTFWLADYMLQSAGILLSNLRGTAPELISIVIPNTLMIAGAVLFLFGMAHFSGVQVKKIPYCIFIALFFSLYYYFSIVSPEVYLRIILFSCGIIFVSIHIVFLCFWKVDKDLRNITKGTGIVFVVFIIVSAVRIISALTDPRSSDYFEGYLHDTTFVILINIIVISLTFSIVLMINSRLFKDLSQSSQEKEQLLLKLRRLATIDGLTGIFNRMKIEEIAANEMLSFQRNLNPLSIILLDIDHFKAVNDTYGHSEGDAVLKTMASLIKDNVRSTDSVGRWGGEEFLIVAPSSDIDSTFKLSQRLSLLISSHNFTNVGHVTVSMGVACAKANSSFFSMLLSADSALYKAKENGRNRVEVSDVCQIDPNQIHI